MGPKIVQSMQSAAWRLADRQHGVVTRRQLLELGFSADSIAHRLATARLHPLWRGVYAVGRREVGQRGTWLAAVLSCGPGAALSHGAAASAYGILPARTAIHVSVPARVARRRPGIIVHRRTGFGADDVCVRDAIPLTSPALTLLDLSSTLEHSGLEGAIRQADTLDLIDPEALRDAIAAMRPRPGIRRLRETLDRRTFRLTDSDLERRMLRLARRAGLPVPETQARVNGFRVDFHWPELGLVVETDGLRYHRTPAQQAHDRVRDQAHAASGLTALRFTHAQVRFEPEHVCATLIAVARLSATAGGVPGRVRASRGRAGGRGRGR
jgi:very-short-patch-repair endonuclease